MANKIKGILGIKFLIALLLLTAAIPVSPISAVSVSGTLQGQVYSNAGPAAGVVVTLYDNGSAVTGATTTTDVNGNYSLASLAYHTYTVHFHDPIGYYQDYEANITIGSSLTTFSPFLSQALYINSFYDTNPMAGLINGSFSWYVPNGSTTVNFNVYFLNANKDIINSVYVPNATQYQINSIPAGAKRIGVQPVFPDGTQGPIISTPLWDNGTLVLFDSLAFYDTNIAPDAIDAKLSWNKAIDETQITKYLIHSVNSSNQRVFIGEVPVSGSVTGYTYTVANFPTTYRTIELSGINALGEESPPFSINVSDNTYGKATLTASSNLALGIPQNFYFADTDQLTGSIGGIMYWRDPTVTTNIYNYEAYYLDAAGAKIASISSLPQSSYSNASYRIFIEKGTSLIMNNKIVKKIALYAQDINGAEGPPTIIDITDNIGSVPRGLFFYDSDQVAGHISGTLSWFSAFDESTILGYRVYWADDADNILDNTPIGESLYNKGLNTYQLSLNQQIPQFGNVAATRLAVVSVDANGIVKKSTTALWDNIFTATWNDNITFYDNNPTPGIIDASISWTHHGGEVGFSDYALYYEDMNHQKIIVGKVPKSGSSTYSFNLTTEMISSLPANLGAIRLGFTDSHNEISPVDGYFKPITISDNTMSGAITTVVTDNLPKAYNLEFSDKDASYNLIGGQLHWRGPNPDSITVEYAVYFVTAQGVKIAPIANVKHASFDDFIVNIPNGTPIPAGSDAIGIFSIDAAGQESTTPASIHIWDAPYANINNVYASFIDTNTNEGAITAELHWNFASFDSNISQYDISYKDSSNMMHLIGQVAKHNSVTEYTYMLTSSQFSLIPGYVKELAINFEDSFGRSGPIVFYIPISDLTTSKTDLSAPFNSNLNLPSYWYSNAFHNSESGLYRFIGWYNPTNSTNITDYEIYFLDKEGHKLESLAKVKKADYFNEVDIPASMTPPATAAKLGVFSKDSSGAESTKYAVLPLYDYVHAALKSNSNTVSIDNVMKFISGDGVFSHDDIYFLLMQIDPIVAVVNTD